MNFKVQTIDKSEPLYCNMDRDMRIVGRIVNPTHSARWYKAEWGYLQFPTSGASAPRVSHARSAEPPPRMRSIGV